jgi:hypothetical protein
MQNFTAIDLVQTTLATLAFVLFLLPPGYLLGLASDAFGMRSRSAVEKILFSVAFSFAATPILAVLLTRISSYNVTLAFFLLMALISVGMLVRKAPRLGEVFSGVQRTSWILLGMMLGWFLLVQFSLVDLQIGQRLYLNYVTFDHSLRVSMVEAAARGGVPPHNPFYGLGKLPVLRYFYYWYVVCALPMRLFGLSAKACFDASVFWSGVGLASLIPLFLKHFCGESENLRSKSLIGIALLCVTGLDLLPYAAQVHRYHMLLPDMEWWDTNQVSSWLGSLLWVPHHVASLTACMVGLLVLSIIEEKTPFRDSAWAAVIAALAFASAAGLSVYVVFAFAIFVILWTFLMLVQKRFQTFAACLASGLLALLLSWPYLQDLLSKQSGGGIAGAADAGNQFAFFAIRDYIPGMEFLRNLGIHSPLLLNLAKLPMLVYVYALEFGFFALVVPLYLRRERHRPAGFVRQRHMAWMMLAVCLLTLSVLQSNTSGFNDLGWRGMLVVQFVLLLWAAPLVDEVFFRRPPAAGTGLQARWVKISLVWTLALGLAGTALQLALLRAYAPLADSGKIVRAEGFLGAPRFGERTYWLRAGFSQLDKLTNPGTSVQYNPIRDEVLIAHLYSTRQAVMGDEHCGSAFGGNAERCRQDLPLFVTVFNGPDAVRGWNLDRFCADFHVNVLVATDADPVWHDRFSWVWMRPALVSNPGMRAIPCGVGSHFMASR